MIEQTENDKLFEATLYKEGKLEYAQFTNFVQYPYRRGNCDLAERQRRQSWFKRYQGEVPASWADIWWKVSNDLEAASHEGVQLSQTLIDAAVTYPSPHIPPDAAKLQELDIVQLALAFKNSRPSMKKVNGHFKTDRSFRGYREYWQPQQQWGRTVGDAKKAWLLSKEIANLEDDYILDNIRHNSRIGRFVQGYSGQTVVDWRDDFDRFIDDLGESSAKLAVNAVTQLADAYSRGQEAIDPQTGDIKWDNFANLDRFFGNIDILRFLFSQVPVIIAVKRSVGGVLTDNKTAQLKAAEVIWGQKMFGLSGLMQGSWPKAGDLVLTWHNDPTSDDVSEYFKYRAFNQQEFDQFNANPKRLPYYSVSREYIPAEYLKYLPSRFLDMLNQSRADHINNYMGDEPVVIGRDTQAEDLGNGSVITDFAFRSAKPFLDALEARIKYRASTRFPCSLLAR